MEQRRPLVLLETDLPTGSSSALASRHSPPCSLFRRRSAVAALAGPPFLDLRFSPLAIIRHRSFSYLPLSSPNPTRRRAVGVPFTGNRYGAAMRVGLDLDPCSARFIGSALYHWGARHTAIVRGVDRSQPRSTSSSAVGAKDRVLMATASRTEEGSGWRATSPAMRGDPSRGSRGESQRQATMIPAPDGCTVHWAVGALGASCPDFPLTPSCRHP